MANVLKLAIVEAIHSLRLQRDGYEPSNRKKFIRRSSIALACATSMARTSGGQARYVTNRGDKSTGSP